MAKADKIERLIKRLLYAKSLCLLLLLLLLFTIASAAFTMYLPVALEGKSLGSKLPQG